MDGWLRGEPGATENNEAGEEQDWSQVPTVAMPALLDWRTAVDQ